MSGFISTSYGGTARMYFNFIVLLNYHTLNKGMFHYLL